MNKISIDGENYSEILRQQLNFYSTSACTLLKDYMYNSRSEWEEDKKLTSEQVSDIDMKNYNNLLNSGRWSNKYPKDYQTLYLEGVAKKIADNSKN